MSLLAWYPLNGDTKDYSGNGNHILNTDTATCTINTEGKIGQCYKFNGTKDGELETPISSSQLKDFTICFWLFNVETNSKSLFGSNINFASRGINFYLYPNNTDFHWATYQSGYDWSTYVQNVIPTNEWTHIALINKEKSKETILFINGRKVFTKKWSSSFVKNNDHIFIGGADDIASSSKFNDVRIYDEALTAMQIKEIAQAKICHYTCNEQMYENTANLLNNRNQITDNGVIEKKWINDHHIEFAVEANTLYKGIRLSTALAAKPLTNYTFSYKIQKIKGTLNRIRGHIESQSFNEISAKIDGISFGYTAGYNVLDNHDTHKVEVTISTKENITNLNKIYIQPNDTTNDYVRVRVWDIQVEEKDHATPFTPDTRIATLKDISGFGYDMTSPLEYSPIWKNDEKKSYCELSGKANFYIDKPFSSFLRQFTYSSWVRTSDTDAYCVIGQSYGSNSDFSLAIVGNKLCLHSYTVSNYSELCDESIALTDENVNDNRWHLLTATYDGINVKTYIDGVLKKTQPYTFKFDRYMSTSLSIGSKDHVNLDSYEWRRFKGDIRDVRVYATALSDEDIKLLYQPEVIIDKSNTVRCSEINEVSKTIKKHIEIKSKGFELKADAKVVIDNYTRIIDTVGWEVIEIKKDGSINVRSFWTHGNSIKLVDLKNHIANIDHNSIIILATKDQPSGNPTMNENNSTREFLQYMNSIGSMMTSDFTYRGAYAGIIYNGCIIKEEISNIRENSSAEIILDELLIDSAILNEETFNGFNKDATLNFNEFIEADDQEVTINKDNALTAKEFKEIY